MNRDGENSPARLTIAQAALLNLKGPSLHGASPQIASPNFGGLSPTFDLNMPLMSESIYGGNIGASPQFQSYGQELTSPNLQSFGSQYDGLNAQAAEFTSRNQLRMPPNPTLDVDNGDLRSQLQAFGTRSKAAARIQDGFTSYERLLLQAHLQRQQEQLAAASAELNSLRAQTLTSLAPNAASSLAGQPISIPSGRRNSEFLPSGSEDEFHAGAAHRSQLPFVEAHSAAVEIKVPPSRQALDLPDAKANFTRQRNQTHAEARAQADAHSRGQSHPVHVRSTTLPSQYTTRDRSSGGTFLNSSAGEGNALKNANVKSSFDSKKNITYPNNNRILGGNNVNSNTNTHTNSNNTSNNSISIDYTHRDTPLPYTAQQNTTNTTTGVTSNTLINSNTRNGHARIDTSSSGRLNAANKRAPPTSRNEQDTSHGNESGSEMSSPALSASTRTPATLSPATPFSAFAETFDGPGPTVVVPGTIHVGAGESGVQQVQQIQQKEVGLGIGDHGGAGERVNAA